MRDQDPPREYGSSYPPAPAHRRQGRALREITVPADAPEALRSLADVERELRTSELRRAKAIVAARAAGIAWDQIAAVLGISRQAAWEKFRDYAMDLLDSTARDATQTDEEALSNAESVLRNVRAERQRS